NDEDPAEDADQREIGEDAPVGAIEQELQRAVGSMRRESRAREIQVRAENGETDRPEGHQADLDPAPREALAKQRADPDTYREQGEQRADHFLSAVEDVLRVDRN